MELFSDAAEAERFIVRTVYARFRETGEWPRARDMDLDYADRLDHLGGIEALCRQMGSDRIWCGSPAGEHDRVTLRLRALADLSEAADDVRNLLAALRFCAKRYRDTRGAEAQVSTEDLKVALKVDDTEAKRMMELLPLADRISAGGGGGRMQLAHFVSRLEDVQSIDDYHKRVDGELARREAMYPGALPLRVSKGPETPPSSLAQVTRLFLSHAADDATLAHFLADKLKQGKPGLDVFIASRPGNIATGEDWLARIRRELRDAEGYLVLLTPTSIEREWIWFESGAAWMSDRRLIPVTAAGLGKADVPLPLGAHQALSLHDSGDVMQLARDLGATIENPDEFCRIVQAICDARPQRAVGASGAVIRARATLDPGRLVLWNSGDVPASDIDIVFAGDSDPIPEDERRRKLPLRTLDPGREYPLIAAFSMGRAPPFDATVSWVDPDGRRRTDTVIIHE